MVAVPRPGLAPVLQQLLGVPVAVQADLTGGQQDSDALDQPLGRFVASQSDTVIGRALKRMPAGILPLNIKLSTAERSTITR
jgi:hypothetical protein